MNPFFSLPRHPMYFSVSCFGTFCQSIVVQFLILLKGEGDKPHAQAE